MAELTDDEFEAANERGRVHFETHPHAKSACYDAATGLMTLELYNGCTFTFPPRRLQGLERATDGQLAEFEISGVGYGLHWDSLDVDFTVPGLLQGIFGSARYMAPIRAELRQMLQDEIDHRHDQAA